MPMKTLICNENGIRLDRFMAENAEMTRSHAAQLCDEQKITVNSKPAKKNLVLKAGDIIEVETPPPVEIDTAAEEIPLNIIYEDSDLLVVDKPQGMVVHPAAGNYSGTLVNALLHHCIKNFFDKSFICSVGRKNQTRIVRKRNINLELNK